MNSRKGISFVLAVAAVLVLVGGWWLHRTLYAQRELGDPQLIEITSGSSVRAAGQQLEAAGILQKEWMLRVVHRLEGRGETIKAGVYELRAGASPASIVRKLCDGEVATLALTIPEGWTIEPVARAFADSLGVDYDRMLELERTPPRRLRAGVGAPDSCSLEGYLFPETYRFARGVSADEVVQTMVETFHASFDDSMRARAHEMGWTIHEIVTLASIVEAEAQLPEERTKVAAVYHNRLRKGWKLEADPTVAYAAGVNGEDLTYGHLQMDSPYNTYRVKGLPPGPINSPGRAAIEATLWPEPDFPAMYFVADGEGGHVFSQTWEQHKRAVREYRRKQRAAGRR